MSTTTDQGTETTTQPPDAGAGRPATGSPEGADSGAERSQDSTNTTGQGQDTGATGDGDQGGNSEAAGYRRRLREAEAERNALAEHLTRHRTRDLERAAGEVLAEPSDLIALGGQDLEEFLTEGGDVDADAVRAAARALVESRPGLKAPTRVTGPIGQGRNTGVPPRSKGNAWADLLQT